MQVCFLVGTLGTGGAETQLIYMLKALKRARVKTRVLCLTKGEALEKDILDSGIDVEWAGRLSNRFLRLGTITNSLRRNRDDIVQSSHFYTNIYAGLAGKMLSIPSIGAIRSDLFSEIALHKYLGNYQVSLPSFLIANSKLAYERAISRGTKSDRICHVRNVVEKSEENGRDQKHSTAQTVLFVGRLDQAKNPVQFVELASKLVKRFPEHSLKFKIAGDGPLKDHVVELAENVELMNGSMEFLGNCSDMGKIYKNADLLISTSLREGTSNVVLEAMSYGLPVIATKVGGTPEILTDERGVLVEPHDDHALENAAAEILSNVELSVKLGSAGKKYVEEFHSLDSLEKSLNEIYLKLLGTGNP